MHRYESKHHGVVKAMTFNDGTCGGMAMCASCNLLVESCFSKEMMMVQYG